jgi:hypothetical protein
VNGESYYDSMEATASAGLPPPRFDVDIGSVGTADGANYSVGTFTVADAGSDIGGTADSFNFAYIAGLAVCSRTTSALNVSTFDNVTTAVWSSPALDTPTGLAAVAGDTQVALTWNASTNANNYNLKRSTTNGGPYSVIGTGSSVPAFTDTGLVNGTKYYYVVSSSNPLGESALSSQMAVRPFPRSPTSINIGISGGRILLSWPQDYPGWHLRAQTNSLDAGLGTNWNTISDSATTNWIWLPVKQGNGSVFFRLVYP